MPDFGRSSRTLSIGSDQLILETGEVARQADGSVIVRQGRAAILVSAVSAASPREGIDFFPLTVDYRELFGAAGLIPHSYNRREGRLSDHEVLSSRIIDRSLRPLFPKGYRNETQIIATLLSADDDVDTDVLGLLGACAAIHLSPVPFNGPAAGLRLCRIDNRFLVNPRRSHRVAADMDLVIAAGRDGLVMMEGHCREAGERDLLKALEAARTEISRILDTLDEWRLALGIRTREFESPVFPEEILAKSAEWLGDQLRTALSHPAKQTRHDAVKHLKQAFLSAFESADDPTAAHQFAEAFDILKKQTVRNRIFDEGIRLDTRGPGDVRPISGAVDWVPTPHGSALFTRGET
ncbi:MAG TPA: polyribonucleotide nucleotidyltransferase, partial [bacterium]|nr:polyribonucleotide nucleotidyltransferase [bacterium]